jgi:uncharacterized protein (DUF952 family)
LAVTTIYKVCGRDEWRAAEQGGQFLGSAVDMRDGFIHFSSAAQVAETVNKHFARQAGLMLVAVDAQALGAALQWERSRNDDLFPHLYAALPVNAVRWVKPLADEVEGKRQFPELEP